MPDNYYQNPTPPLSKTQKIAVAVLSIFAVLVVVFWYAQFKKTISGEWAEDAGEARNSPLAQNDNSEEELRAKDTDKDGLSDWDELNLYKTSPYLEDSDSDGFRDKEEVDAGKDPNCPAGRDCSVGSADSLTSTSTSVLLPSYAPNLNIGTATEDMLNNMFSGASDVASLRKALLDAGMDKNLLDQISDEELIKSYNETLANPPTQ